MMEDILNLQIFSEGESADTEALSEAEEFSEDPTEEFERLIKGKYADAFRDRTQGIIDKRFAKMKGYEKTAKAVSPLLTELTARFPSIDKSDTEGLVRAFLEKGEKEKEEKPVEDDILSSAEVSQAIRNAAKNRARENLALHLQKESEKLREIYPSFDLERELDSSPEFMTLLSSGVSLRRAFETVNLESILGSALRFAVMKAQRDTADILRSNTRVSENSVQDRASSVKRTDVNSLTERDIMKILSQVSRGAKISF